MARERTIVGVDVGTTKVCTLIADASSAGPPQVIGAGLAPAHGMRKGLVVDVERVVESIATSLERAEQDAGRRVDEAYISFTGAHVASLNNRGVIGVAREDRAIGADDVQRALEAARVVNVPANREIIHAVPRHFIVDGQDGVRNPVGMLGVRLDVEAHLVTGAATALQNLLRCVEQAGIAPIELVLGSLAAAEATITSEERDMGVALVDVGGGTTSITVFADGSPWHTAVIPVGGVQVTNDIGVGLRTPFPEAEELKISHGRASAATYNPDEAILVQTFGDSERVSVPGRQLGEIIEARMTELFQLIGAELARSEHLGRLPAGVVLMGGTALLRGICDLGSLALNLPCRVGRVHSVAPGVVGLREAFAGPAFATSVGLVAWGARALGRSGVGARHRPPPVERAHGVATDADVAGRVRSWLRAFLP